MPSLIYHCPSTGMDETVWYEIDDGPRERTGALLESVVCKACGQVHLVDPKSGRVVGTKSI
jgi:hypothetical protein